LDEGARSSPTAMTPTDWDRDTAALISEYLVLGMHHSTKEGLEAIATIIATARYQEMQCDAAEIDGWGEWPNIDETPQNNPFAPPPAPDHILDSLPEDVRF
jgi:hypothetical protein